MPKRCTGCRGGRAGTHHRTTRLARSIFVVLESYGGEDQILKKSHRQYLSAIFTRHRTARRVALCRQATGVSKAPERGTAILDTDRHHVPWHPMSERASRYQNQSPASVRCCCFSHSTLSAYHTGDAVSYTHLTLPTNREV